MGIFNKIKSFFSLSDKEIKASKDKMRGFMQQAFKKDDLSGFEIVYRKLAEKKDTIMTRKTLYHNYAIAFNSGTKELVILPIDPKLASCGWPVFINDETLKSAEMILYGTTYSFDLKDGDNIMFEVPSQNYKIGKLLGAMEIPIKQEKEAKAFKTFFKSKFG